jgi:hypothetical protein
MMPELSSVGLIRVKVDPDKALNTRFALAVEVIQERLECAVPGNNQLFSM